MHPRQPKVAEFFFASELQREMRITFVPLLRIHESSQGWEQDVVSCASAYWQCMWGRERDVVLVHTRTCGH